MARIITISICLTTYFCCQAFAHTPVFSWFPGVHDFMSIYDLYSFCSNDTGLTLEDCFKTEVVTLLDQAVRVKNVTISEGVTLVGNSVDSYETEDVGWTGRSNNIADRNILEVVYRKLKSFVENHSTLSVSLGEGRRRGGGGGGGGKLKIKKMMLPFLVGVVMKVASFLPVIFGIMKIMGLHAFFTSKAALGIIGLIGLRKLLWKKSSHHSSHHHHDPYVYHHGGGGEPIAAIQRKSTGEIKHIIFLDK